MPSGCVPARQAPVIEGQNLIGQTTKSVGGLCLGLGRLSRMHEHVFTWQVENYFPSTHLVDVAMLNFLCDRI
jgi:hypothetical protein